MGSEEKKHKKKKKKRKHNDDVTTSNTSNTSNTRLHNQMEETVETSNTRLVPQIELPQSNKDEAFIWKKKQERDGLDKLSVVDQELLSKMKEKEKKIELWKVQRRREERELEQAARAEELDRVRLEKESEMFKEWQEQEGQFHLEQARLRSELRIQNNRANPIDLLAFYIHHADDTNTQMLGDPLHVVQSISPRELEDLQADIAVYKDLDRNKTEHLFWEDLEVVCQDQAIKHKTQLKVERNRSSINAAVGVDVSKIFKSKTSLQLTEMYKGIKKKLKVGGPIDVSYWEKVAEQAFVEISKARMREKHEDIIRRREFAKKTKAATSGESTSQLFPIPTVEEKEEEERKKEEEEERKKEEEEEQGEKKKKKKKKKKKEAVKSCTLTIVKQNNDDEVCIQEYEDLCYTPIRVDTIGMEALVYTDSKLTREVEQMRCEVIGGATSKDRSIPRDLDLEAQAQALMGAPDEDEELFNTDLELANTDYSWASKYKPRKPRFYNRVHTGYEWNKYNQTHYDQDNPPPKIVQGYKFNIFYQDLIDISTTPEYKLTICTEDKEFCILKIAAGPPYEDIAFKVLNKEWEYSNRYSFKSQFSQGIFQLWFQFKKYRYRR